MTTDEKVDLLISLFKEFKSDVNRRFDEVDKKFVDVNRRFDEQENRMERLERNQERLEEKIERTDTLVRDIWISRDKVRAQVTWDFIWKAVVINAIILFGILGSTGQIHLFA